MQFRQFDEVDEVAPVGHSGFRSRRLVSKVSGGDGKVSVTHATIEPGGTSGLHLHEDSTQIYLGLSGTLTVGDDVHEYELVPMASVVFEAGTLHFVENRSSEVAVVLVITAPELERA